MWRSKKKKKRLNTSKTLIIMTMLHQIFLNYLWSCFIQSISWTWVTKMLVDKMLMMTLRLISFTFPLVYNVFVFVIFISFSFFLFLIINHVFFSVSYPKLYLDQLNETLVSKMRPVEKKDWMTLPEHIVRVFWVNIWTHKIVFKN